jgi:teichuronic acid biosynthesis glycosyltransferase TuaC
MAAPDVITSVFMVLNCNVKSETPQISSFVKSQAESLRDAGWEVSLGIVDDRTSLHGIVRNIRRLKREIGHARPGLVHAQYGSMTAAIASFIKGSLPLVVSFCGDDLLGTQNPELIWNVREKCARITGLGAARRAAAVIVKSKNLMHALPTRLKNIASVLPNGVDMSLFTPMPRDEARTRVGWMGKGKVVLFNASHNDNQNSKNPSLARAVIDTLARDVSDVSLEVLSNASQEEVRLRMNAADCLLVTSLHEGSPNIVKEAMACNLPVVSVTCGDVAERLKNTYPGGICPYDAQNLARAVHDVLKANLRSNGREQVVAQGLTLTNVAERLVKLYHDVQKESFSITKGADKKHVWHRGTSL